MRAVSAITVASNGGPDGGISSDETRGAIQPIISTGVALSGRMERSPAWSLQDWRAAFHRQKTHGALSKNGFDIGLRKIIADIEQPAGMLLRHFIGEAIAKIQGSRVQASSPALIRLGDTSRGGRRHGHDLKHQPPARRAP